ncbi:hypothetical protein Scep_008337 [Stephania cephalantha]|uniref:Heptahelical transmembrane protein 1-like n=1 Tax=Stephania cephalantha TaxID=152367 RepID=A0AAP0KE81_9MAGN
MGLSEEGHAWKRRSVKEMQEIEPISSKGEDKERKNKRNKKGKCYDLVSYSDLPDYMKDNEYILDYYRANWPIKVAFFSLFRWHNETLNVWTHLIGFGVFMWLTMVNLMQIPLGVDFLGRFTRSFPSTPATFASNNSKNFFLGEAAAVVDAEKSMNPLDITMQSSIVLAPRWPCFVYLGGSMFCLITSSMCHLFCCHSKRLNLLLLQFDYVGIAVMIITSFFPQMYYIFQCNPFWQFVYLSGVTLMGIFTIVTLLSPVFSTGAFRKFRAFLFVSMGCFGIIPAVHASVLHWNEPLRFITLAYESAMALSYATGTLFYVSRVPERWKPGWFDLAGHSHQIFHVFVVMGALAHYGAMLVFLKWRDEVGCTR